MEVSRDSAITQCVASSKYNFILEEILEDKRLGGAYDYYKDTKTSYDPPIGRLQRDIKFYTLASEENRKLMDIAITNITNAKRDPKDEQHKKASKADMERWTSDCSKLQIAFVTYKSQLDVLQPQLDDCLFNRYIEESKRNTMKMLRDKFFMDGDKDYLAKGITWAMEYAEKHRISIDLNSLPKC